MIAPLRMPDASTKSAERRASHQSRRLAAAKLFPRTTDEAPRLGPRGANLFLAWVALVLVLHLVFVFWLT